MSIEKCCAAAYIRVSTDDQTEYSPEAQKKAILKYAENNNMYILPEHIYIDEGISGRKAEKRPAFMKMISTAKNKQKPFDVILVHKFDRFARNREDSVVYKSLLRKQCGIKVISITENIEDDRIGILVEPMLEALAEYYSVNLSEEVKKGMTEKALRGEYQTASPFGYKCSKGKMTIVEEEAKYIKFIFNEFLNGTPQIQIAKTLNQIGVKTHRGNKFENRTIEYILNNPVYCGYVRWTPTGKTLSNRNFDCEDTITVKGSHEPIIDEEVYNKTKNKLKQIKSSRKSHSRPQTEYKHYLSGILKCSSCGATLSFSGKSNAFQCWKYSHALCSDSHYISANNVVKNIKIELNRVINENDFDNYKIQIKETQTNETQIIKKKIENLNKRLNRLKEGYLNGIFDINEYKLEKEKIENELKETKLPEKRKFDKDIMIKKIPNVLEILKDDKIDLNTKNTALKSIVDKIVFNKNDKSLDFYYFL